MGHAEVPLDNIGRQQAVRTATLLRRWDITRIVSSPLARARETAEILAGPLNLSVDLEADWREVDVGALRGLCWSEIETAFPDFVARWRSDPVHTPRPGGESDYALKRRVVRGFQRAQTCYAGERSVIVSHGGTIRAILTHILGMDLKDKWRLAIDNGSISVLKTTRRGWVLTALNETAHFVDERA